MKSIYNNQKYNQKLRQYDQNKIDARKNPRHTIEYETSIVEHESEINDAILEGINKAEKHARGEELKIKKLASFVPGNPNFNREIVRCMDKIKFFASQFKMLYDQKIISEQAYSDLLYLCDFYANHISSESNSMTFMELREYRKSISKILNSCFYAYNIIGERNDDSIVNDEVEDCSSDITYVYCC